MTLAKKLWAAFLVLFVLAELASLPAGGAEGFGVAIGTVVGAWLMYLVPVAFGRRITRAWNGWRGEPEAAE